MENRGLDTLEHKGCSWAHSAQVLFASPPFVALSHPPVLRTIHAMNSLWPKEVRKTVHYLLLSCLFVLTWRLMTQRIPKQDQAALQAAQELISKRQNHRMHNEMVQDCFLDCVKVCFFSIILSACPPACVRARAIFVSYLCNHLLFYDISYQNQF